MEVAMMAIPFTIWLRLLALLFALSGCAQLTFSKDEAIDFDSYPSVRVNVTSPNSVADTEYLASELRAGSGFTTVITSSGEATSLSLNVSLQMAEEVSVDGDGNIDSSWVGEAIYTATDAAGQLVETGSIDDSSEFPSELAEDLLDEVALHYLKPFRI
jgi:hypothetical protein